MARWLRARLNRRALDGLYQRRSELAMALREGDPFRPTVGGQHTQGMYDGINYAIDLLGREASDG